MVMSKVNDFVAVITSNHPPEHEPNDRSQYQPGTRIIYVLRIHKDRRSSTLVAYNLIRIQVVGPPSITSFNPHHLAIMLKESLIGPNCADAPHLFAHE